MNIAILGCGAVGSLLGALLFRAGHTVDLIGDSDHLREIEKNGLQIRSTKETYTVFIATQQCITTHYDIYFLAVKIADVEAACTAIKPFAKNSIVIPLQNGVHTDTLCATLLPESILLSGIVLFNAQFFTPGTIIYGTPGSVLLGDPTGNAQAVLERVTSILQSALPTKIIPHVKESRYAKLIINSINNSLDTLTGLPLNICIKSYTLRLIGILILRETITILKGAGINLSVNVGFSISDFVKLTQLPLPYAAFLLGIRMKKRLTGTVYSSTLQSIMRKRATEIDFLHGEIVQLAKTTNQHAPYNALVVSLVHTIEKNGVFYSPKELKKYFFAIKK